MKRTLSTCLIAGRTEAGCDEAGRGCLAGAVYAAAVIFPSGYYNSDLNDSKQLSEKQREKLRTVIERDACAWSVASVSAAEIDKHNILKASIMAMHRAISKLDIQPQHLLIDGNRFIPYKDIPHTTLIKGDSQYLTIAAASILAKTHRDEQMQTLHALYPAYRWDLNKGYPTQAHRDAIRLYGITPEHRRTFTLLPPPTLFD